MAAPRMQFKSVSYTGMRPGPRLIVLGAVHGNESCGTQAIDRLMEELDEGGLRLARGSLTLVPVANPIAYALGRRFGQRNLNRQLFPYDEPEDAEDFIANWLCPLLASHDVLLDLHSFQDGGEPFAMVGPQDNAGTLEPFAHCASERAFARHLGVPRFVDGWMATYGKGVRQRAGDPADVEAVLRFGVGTTEYMRHTGGYGVTLECGQHADPQAPRVAYRAIRNALVFLGLVEGPASLPIADHDVDALSLVEVHDRLHPDDRFSRDWASFDRLEQGQEIGRRADGSAVLAPFDGLIVFPDPKAAAGSEWFYLARANRQFFASP
ncbi:succinylglutamate desuccinylase/aspartoacylase family protein [Oxalobacteraceae bacterium]|nr:succinylglutamate desuccinylase/aspartoacylase family protein [Oxalobacteraceae bacterium]